MSFRRSASCVTVSANTPSPRCRILTVSQPSPNSPFPISSVSPRPPAVTPTRHSRPLASLAPLDRVLADATLDRAFAGAILENLDKRITAPCGWPRPVGKRPSRAKRVPSKRAARSRTASTASGLAPLELPSIAALHSALPPSPPAAAAAERASPPRNAARRLQAIKLSAILSSFDLL